MIILRRLAILPLFWFIAVLSGHELDKANLPPNPTEAQVRSYLRVIQNYLENTYQVEYTQIGAMAIKVPEPDVLRRLDAKFAAVPTTRLDVMLKAMAKSGSPVFEQLTANAVIAPGRTGFLPEHRDLLHRHLAAFPKLILLIERLGWLDLSHPGFVKAWKQAKQTRVNGSLDEIGIRLAHISARQGWTDALPTVAQSAQKRIRHLAEPGQLKSQETEYEMLEMLVPGQRYGPDLAEFILAHGNRLSFDRDKGGYTVQP